MLLTDYCEQNGRLYVASVVTIVTIFHCSREQCQKMQETQMPHKKETTQILISFFPTNNKDTTSTLFLPVVAKAKEAEQR